MVVIGTLVTGLAVLACHVGCGWKVETDRDEPSIAAASDAPTGSSASIDLKQLEAAGAMYLERLAGVLDRPLDPVDGMGADGARAPAAPTPWPSRRALMLPVTPHSVDGLEFLQAHGCDLGALIGYRNSPLGRTQRASQRLAYEVEWLRVAAACRAAPPWVAALMAEKRDDLPRLYWNATLGGDEFRVAAGRSRPRGTGDFAYLLRSLHDQYRALAQPISADRSSGVPSGFDGAALEATLGELSRASHIGPARASWAVQRRVLDTAADAIADAASTGTGLGVCPQGRPTPRSRYLGNVFARFYLGALQPLLAESQRRDAAWIEALGVLLDALRPVAPHVFLGWHADVLDADNADSEWARTRQSVVRHAKAWQQLFATCAIDPQSLRLGD